MKTQSLYHLKKLFNNVKTDYTYIGLISQKTANKIQNKILQNKHAWHSICLALHYNYVLIFDDNYLLLSIINNNTSKIKSIIYLKDDLKIL